MTDRTKEERSTTTLNVSSEQWKKELNREAKRKGFWRSFRNTVFSLITVAAIAVLVAVLLRSLVVDNIPLIGGFLAEVIHAIEARM